MSSEVSPRQIGRYELFSSLGKGGMGHVYRARLSGPGGASKPVALKLIHEHLSGQESFTRLFLEEVRIAMALSHRNIVQTFDGGESEGRQFLVMEFVSGLSLWEFLKRTPSDTLFPADIALFVGMEICAALDYGHNFQPEHTGHPGRVLHRDVSPTNILLSEQGDVKLTDYGVAKAAGSLSMTSPNLIKGKLPYMAPEQAKGEECVQSDLFSLGAVLYQMLASRPIRGSVTLDQVRDGRPKIPSLASLRPDLPASLVELVDGCLCNSVHDRPKNAWALREALANESMALQQGPDLHGRMRSFFEDLTGQRQSDTDSAAQLAQVMLQRVQAMSIASEAQGASETEMGATLPATPEAKVALAATLPTPTSMARLRRPGWLLAAVFVALASLATLWFWMRASDKTSPPALRTVAAKAVDGAVRDSGASDARAARIVRANPIDMIAPDQQVDQKAKRRLVRKPKRRLVRKRDRRRGWLDLNAVPWAKVYIDGVFRGETPIQRLSLRAGKHRVRVVNPSLRLSASVVVMIRPNRTVTRVINLRHAK